MSEKLPRVSAEKLTKVLLKLGFQCVRQSGSHQIYRNAQGIRVTVPVHSKKILHPKIIRTILHDVGLSIKEFRQLL